MTPTNDNATAGRFDPLWSLEEMMECPEGQYVRASDYAELQARLAKAEAALHDEAILHEATAQQRDRAYVKLNAALSREKEAKAEGIRAAYDAVVAMEWTGDGDDVCDMLRALAQSGGDDPAQGKTTQGDEQ